jgi:deoxyribodipyrimidine photolyase-related protein
MTTIGVWILGDQLWQESSALASISFPAPVILIESLNHVRVRPYHQQKLVLVWSAMRHFAAQLEAQGHAVTYCESEDFQTPLRSWIKQTGITELRVMAPADKPFAQLISDLDLPCKLRVIENNQFLWTEAEFCQWATPRKRLLMEDFYRECRKRYGILMEKDGKPVGDRWNFDPENRKPPKKNDPNFNPPEPQWFEPDQITQTVIEKVQNLDLPTYGELESFGWAVTRSDALQVLDTFIQTRLASFGPYQDAMVTGEYTMWHALISPYLNIGLLHPLEVVQAVEEAYEQQDLPLNGVEGLIRQVIGWREYMRGVYAFSPAKYAESNWFEHDRPLPEFFWNASAAKMNCLRQCLEQNA